MSEGGEGGKEGGRVFEDGRESKRVGRCTGSSKEKRRISEGWYEG